MSCFRMGWRMFRPPPHRFHPTRIGGSSGLERPVNGGEQRGDGRTHGLVADEHYDRDCGEDQRVFSHRLAALILTHLNKHVRDLFHFRVLLSQFFWPKLAVVPVSYAKAAS